MNNYTDYTAVFKESCISICDLFKEGIQTNVSLEDCLLAAAVPAVFYNRKDSDRNKCLYDVIIQFVNKHKHFRDYSKQAVFEGLKNEWIKNIDSKERMQSLLSDFKLISGWDENGCALLNQSLYNTYKDLQSTHFPYGKKEYTPVSVKKHKVSSSVGNGDVYSWKPEDGIELKLKPFIEWYIRNWSFINAVEGYKWEQQTCFENNFDIETKDSVQNMLVNSFAKQTNMISGNYGAMNIVLKLAGLYPEDIRKTFSALFLDSQDIRDNIYNFKILMSELFARGQKEYPDIIKEGWQDNNTIRAVSAYLSWRFPDRHYYCTYQEYCNFCKETKILVPKFGRATEERYYGYSVVASAIRDVLIKSDELKNLNDNSYPDDKSDYHLLTQDFIYAIGRHYIRFNRIPDINILTNYLDSDKEFEKKRQELIDSYKIISSDMVNC